MYKFLKIKMKKKNFFKTYFKNLIDLLSVLEFAELDKYLSLFLDVKKIKEKY